MTLKSFVCCLVLIAIVYSLSGRMEWVLIGVHVLLSWVWLCVDERLDLHALERGRLRVEREREDRGRRERGREGEREGRSSIGKAYQRG